MKMVIIMNYKMILYVIFVLLSTYTLSGINFDKIMKRNKPLEARILVLLTSLLMGYFLTNFVLDFIKM